MSSKYNKYGSFIKNTFTNPSDLKPKKEEKKIEQKVIPSSKRLTGLFIGVKSNGQQGESKNNQEEAILFHPRPNVHKDNLDEPPPETLGQYHKVRKEIIFGNLIENENKVKQLILTMQLDIIQHYKKKTGSFFGERTIDIYNIMLNFKEIVSNYLLIIHIYLKKKQNRKALELFLLMCSKNKEIIEYFYRKIKEQLPKISNSNRIAKFFPNITRLFIQLLSCFIKFSLKFCKSKLYNYFVKYYLKTIYVVSETVIAKFGGLNNIGSDNDIKHIGRYFYRNFIFDISIFFFMRYEPLFISIFILQHILELHQDKTFNELLDIEQVLLLKTYYNLGLFLYVNGNTAESINYLNQTKKRLSEIKFLPLTTDRKEKCYNINENNTSNEQLPILSKFTYNNKEIESFPNNDDSKRSSNIFLSKIGNHKKEKNDNNNSIVRASGNSFLDLTQKRTFNPNINRKDTLILETESKTNLPRKSSGVLFGNQIMTLKQTEKILRKKYIMKLN